MSVLKKIPIKLTLPIVIIVWGTMGYKFFSGISPNEAPVFNENQDFAFTPKQQIANDTFSIRTVARDPFLGTLTTKKQKSSSKTKINLRKLLEVSKTIVYSGLVKKQNSSDQVFIININNAQYLLKKGQIADSVKLIRGTEKDIVVRYKGKSQTIKRQ